MIERKYRVGLNRKMYIKMFIAGCTFSAVLAATITLVVCLLMYRPYITVLKNNHSNEIATLSDTYQINIQNQKETFISRYNNDTESLRTEIAELKSELEIKEDALKRLESENDASFDMLRKYWYVFKHTGSNSGFSVELIEHIDNTSKKWNVNPHWMFSIYWVESNLKAKVDNTTGSGARGLGQVIPSTGKYYWETVFNNGPGSFTNSMLYDPFVNVEITVAIIGQHLKNGWTMYQALNQYSGNGGMEYYNEVISAGHRFGVTLTDYNWNYS